MHRGGRESESHQRKNRVSFFPAGDIKNGQRKRGRGRQRDLSNLLVLSIETRLQGKRPGPRPGGRTMLKRKKNPLAPGYLSSERVLPMKKERKEVIKRTRRKTTPSAQFHAAAQHKGGIGRYRWSQLSRGKTNISYVVGFSWEGIKRGEYEVLLVSKTFRLTGRAGWGGRGDRPSMGRPLGRKSGKGGGLFLSASKRGKEKRRPSSEDV